MLSCMLLIMQRSAACDGTPMGRLEMKGEMSQASTRRPSSARTCQHAEYITRCLQLLAVAQGTSSSTMLTLDAVLLLLYTHQWVLWLQIRHSHLRR